MEETGIVIDDFDLTLPLENVLHRDEAGRPYEKLTGVIAARTVNAGKYNLSQFKGENRVALVVNVSDNQLRHMVAIKLVSAKMNSRGDIVISGPRIKEVPTKFI